MPLVKAVCRAGHMDQIGIDKNQIPGSCLVLSVIKKEDPFPLDDIKNLILGMEMLYTHIKGSRPNHLFQGNTVCFSVISHFFHAINILSTVKII